MGTIVFGILIGTFSLFFCVLLIPHNFSTYYETKHIYETKAYRVVEGNVERFHPMPYTGHSLESFEVKGITFRYSDFDKSYYGFNNTQSHGGSDHFG